MHSTFSRTRHSTRISAPDISLEAAAGAPRSTVLDDMLNSCSLPNQLCADKTKGHRLGLFTPPMASRNLFPKPSGGAGYGDLNNNGQQPRNETDSKRGSVPTGYGGNIRGQLSADHHVQISRAVP